MKTIYKYQVVVTDEPEISMPRGAQILSFQTQNEQPCIWVLVNPDEPVLEIRKFYLRGTGHPIQINPSALRFIGTTQLMGGMLVFHLFEIVK